MQVERFEFVTAFSPDDSISLLVGPILRELQKTWGGQLHRLNVPDAAPPELPRVVHRFQDGVLNVGSSRFQLVLRPPSHVSEDYGEAAAFARKRGFKVFNALADSISGYMWSGVIANLQFPERPMVSHGNIQAVSPLVQSLLRLDWSAEELASFRLSIGRRAGDFYRNYTLSGYEKRHLEVSIPAGSSEPVTVSSSEGVVQEVGVEILLDVNDKPSARRQQPMQDLERTATEHAKAFKHLFDDLPIGGALS